MHRNSPEPCSDAGPSTLKIASISSIKYHSELAEGSVGDFCRMLYAAWLGHEGVKKGEGVKKRVLICSCYPTSFEGASKWDGPLKRVLVLLTRS